jgi:dihydrofolate reductase
VGLGLAAVLDRQRVDTLDDHEGLVLGHLAGGHRVPDRFVVVVQRGGQGEAAFGVAFGLPGLVGPPGGGVGGAGLGAELEHVGPCRMPSSRAATRACSRCNAAEVGVGLGRRVHSARAGDLRSWSRSAAIVRRAARVLPGVVEYRCHTGNSGIGTDSSGPGMGYSGRLWRSISKSFWSPGCGGFETALARLLNHRHRATREQPQPRAVPLPVAAPFNPMTTRSREEVSTPARWRSLLDHRSRARPDRSATMSLAGATGLYPHASTAPEENDMTATYTFDVFSSLDGFGAASGDWTGYWGKQGPELLDHRLALYDAEQRMVFGANTYRAFAQMLASSTEESVRDPWVTRMRSLPATVVSTTLEAPLDWPDATVESGDAVDVVARLKEESEVPLRSHGSLSMNRALMAAGLVDRVQVTLFPVITGQTGLEPIFGGAADFDLELVENRTLDGHIQELVYRPSLH